MYSILGLTATLDFTMASRIVAGPGAAGSAARGLMPS